MTATIVTLTIGERPFAVAPFRLKQLRLIAPHVEAMNAIASRVDAAQRAGEPPTITDLFEMSRELCEIIAVGLEKIDPAMTADALEDMVDLTFLPSLQAGVRALLEASGLFAASGEALAPSSPAETAGA